MNHSHRTIKNQSHHSISTTSTSTSITNQTDPSNQIQAALHAFNRFNEQAKPQQSPMNPTSTSAHQNPTSRTSHSNLKLGFKTMNLTPTESTALSPNSNPKPISNEPIHTSSNQTKSNHSTINQTLSETREIEKDGDRIRNRSESESSSSNTSLMDHQSQEKKNENKPIKVRSSRGSRRKSSKSNSMMDSPPLPVPEMIDMNLKSDQIDLQNELKTNQNRNLMEEDQSPILSENDMNQKIHHKKDSSIHSTIEQIKTVHQETIVTSNPSINSFDSISSIEQIESRINQLSINDQISIKRTIESLPKLSSEGYPLPVSWNLFFSDSSSTSTKSNSSKAFEYQSGMTMVFHQINSVEKLCNSLNGFKKFIASKCKGSGFGGFGFGGGGAGSEGLEKPGNGIGLIGLKTQQNLHFFRDGVNPVWEDPWNCKGGRLTISLNITSLDIIFESLILLSAGGVIENETNYKGKLIGIVGSRRNRGDRIEIWLSGLKSNQPPNEDWIKDVIQVLEKEIGVEVKGIKFKKHL